MVGVIEQYFRALGSAYSRNFRCVGVYCCCYSGPSLSWCSACSWCHREVPYSDNVTIRKVHCIFCHVWVQSTVCQPCKSKNYAIIESYLVKDLHEGHNNGLGLLKLHLHVIPHSCCVIAMGRNSAWMSKTKPSLDWRQFPGCCGPSVHFRDNRGIVFSLYTVCSLHESRCVIVLSHLVSLLGLGDLCRVQPAEHSAMLWKIDEYVIAKRYLSVNFFMNHQAKESLDLLAKAPFLSSVGRISINVNLLEAFSDMDGLSCWHSINCSGVFCDTLTLTHPARPALWQKPAKASLTSPQESASLPNRMSRRCGFDSCPLPPN